MRRQIVTGLLTTATLLVLLCGIYPLAVWGVGRIAFTRQAEGSFVKVNGKVVGSSLIGQNFSDSNGNPLSQYFQPRPSAAGNGYDPTSSSGSNLGPLNPKLIGNNINDPQNNPYRTPTDPYCVPVSDPKTGVLEKSADGTYVCNPNTVPERVIAYRSFNGLAPDAKVPIDAVTASGSGLDPDISIANALDQAPRVAKVRNRNVAEVLALIHAHTSSRGWGFLGEKTVNVLDLNIALDAMR